jgi:hypothetical protein
LELMAHLQAKLDIKLALNKESKKI